VAPHDDNRVDSDRKADGVVEVTLERSPRTAHPLRQIRDDVLLLRCVHTTNVETGSINPNLVLEQLGIEQVDGRTDGDVVAVGLRIAGRKVMSDQPPLPTQRLERLRGVLLAPRASLPAGDVLRHQRIGQHEVGHPEHSEDEALDETPLCRGPRQ